MDQHEIIFCVEEIDTLNHNNTDNTNTDFLLLCEEEQSSNEKHALTIFYQENCTVKELMLICEYYGLAKDLRTNKCNKVHIIDFLVCFETAYQNIDLVHRRRNMWYFMDELRKDKFMKKFLLW